MLVLLGAWGVLIPFFGEEFGLSYTATEQWEWTAARGWLQVLPGLVAILGGVVLIMSRNRFTAVLGAWLSALAGVWFLVGRAVAAPLGVGYPDTSSTTGTAQAMWAELANFTGLGAAIVLLAAIILGRLSVRSIRDIRYADSPSTVSRPLMNQPPQHDSAVTEDAERLRDPASRHERRHRVNLFGRQNTTPAH